MKRLSPVYFIGGSACAGKTTAAQSLAERYDIPVYSCDEHFEAHRQRADPERHPRFVRLMERPPEELWLGRPEALAAELVGFYEDEWGMVLEDLEDRSGPLLVEGAGVLPGLVHAAIGDCRRAVWLVSTPQFRRRLYRGRGSWVGDFLGRYTDPEAAWENWMSRDDLHGRTVAGEAERLGGRVMDIDGRRSASDVAEEIAAHFKLHLRLHVKEGRSE